MKHYIAILYLFLNACGEGPLSSQISPSVTDSEKESSEITNQDLQNFQNSNLFYPETQALRGLSDIDEKINSSVHQAIQALESRLSVLIEDKLNAFSKNTENQLNTLSKNTEDRLNTLSNSGEEPQVANLEDLEAQADKIASLAVSQALEELKQEIPILLSEGLKNVSLPEEEPSLKDLEVRLSALIEDKLNRLSDNKQEPSLKDLESRLLVLIEDKLNSLNNKNQTEDLEAKTARLSQDIQDLEAKADKIASLVVSQALEELKQEIPVLLSEGLKNISPQIVKDTQAPDLISPVETQNPAFFNRDSSFKKNLISDFPFEECDWTNKNYTAELVKNHSFFLLSHPIDDLISKWEEYQNELIEKQGFCESQAPTNKEACFPLNQTQGPYDYLKPFYDNFIQSLVYDISLSEQDVPLECFFASAVKGAYMYNPGSNFYYCEKDSQRQSRRMSVQDEKQNQRFVSARRACLNKNYMYLTARAFNKTANCFGFTKNEKESFFKLFNHESSFLHNVKSPTGAKCYGQLTTDTIQEINKQIYFRDGEPPLPYSYIFEEVIDKCPGLQNAVLSSDITDPVKTTGKKTMSKFNSITSRLPIVCNITQNPYSCLFYAFYNIKKNSVEIKNQLNKATSNFSKNNNIPKAFKKQFFLPIKLNAMVAVKTKEDKDLIFWDDSELWSVLNNRSQEVSHIRTLTLFENEKQIMELFNLWTYNGGISIALNYMARFIKQLKRSISSPCLKDQKTKYCVYRFAILKGQGIATQDIKKDFQAYIQNNYQKGVDQIGEDRRREVSYFVNNVNRNVSYFYDEKSQFVSHLKDLVPELEDSEIEAFREHLKAVCPKP